MITVHMDTSKGLVTLELDGDKAPETVGNFVEYAKAGFYDGTVFHRVIPGFMAQAGGHTPDLKVKETDDTIPNESGNGLSNVRGTWGYTVFGQVIEGMETVDKIVSVETGPQGRFASDVPQIPIIIKKISRYTFE